MTAMRKTKPLSKREMELMVENWNLKYPVGTKVTVTKDDKTTVETETTSEADVLGGHTPVIWLKDIRGCYLLTRVTPPCER